MNRKILNQLIKSGGMPPSGFRDFPGIASLGEPTTLYASNAIEALLRDERFDFGDIVKGIDMLGANGGYKPPDSPLRRGQDSGANAQVKEVIDTYRKLRERFGETAENPHAGSMTATGRDSAYLDEVANALLDDYVIWTGDLSEDLVSFYKAKGVPPATIERLRRGELDMSQEGREARAKELGLVYGHEEEPKMGQLIRIDRPGKQRFLGRRRGGLVYASGNVRSADRAAQTSGRIYDIIARPIVGLDNTKTNPVLARPEFTDELVKTLREHGHTGNAFENKLIQMLQRVNELPSTIPSNPGIKGQLLDFFYNAYNDNPLIRNKKHKGAMELGDKFLPHWSKVEPNRGADLGFPVPIADNLGMMPKVAARDAINSSGYGGMLVRDEGPISVAITDPDHIRHANLSILDTKQMGESGGMWPITGESSVKGSGIYGALLPMAAGDFQTQAPPPERPAEYLPTEVKERPAGYMPEATGESKAVDQWRQNVSEALSASLAPEQLIADLELDNLSINLINGNEGDARPTMLDTITAFTVLQHMRAAEAKMAEAGKTVEEQAARIASPEFILQARDDAREQLFSTEDNPVKRAAIELSMASFNGEYSQYAGRSPEEVEQAQKQFGASADFTLTSAGLENHKHLAAAELLSAGTDNFIPSYTSSTVLRGVGKFLSPMQRGIQYATGKAGLTSMPKPIKAKDGSSSLLEPFHEEQMLSEPDGKFLYANNLYERSKQANGSIYTDNGLPKYNTYSGYNIVGFGNTKDANASYPLGFIRNSLIDPVGNYFTHRATGDAAKSSMAATDIGTNYNRVTPHTPPGLTPEQFREFGERLGTLRGQADDFMSAHLGPAIPNVKFEYRGSPPVPVPVIQKERTFLSPFADNTVDFFRDLATDGLTYAALPVGAAGGAAFGAASKTGQTLIPRLLKGAGTGMAVVADPADEFVEDTATSLGISAAAGLDAFTGLKENSLAQELDPNDPEYYSKLGGKRKGYVSGYKQLGDDYFKAMQGGK